MSGHIETTSGVYKDFPQTLVLSHMNVIRYVLTIFQMTWFHFCVLVSFLSLENVGKMLLAILVSVAAGILLLILISICSMCCKKYRKQAGKFDVEDDKEVEVSAPVDDSQE